MAWQEGASSVAAGVCSLEQECATDADVAAAAADIFAAATKDANVALTGDVAVVNIVAVVVSTCNFNYSRTGEPEKKRFFGRIVVFMKFQYFSEVNRNLL